MRSPGSGAQKDQIHEAARSFAHTCALVSALLPQVGLLSVSCLSGFWQQPARAGHTTRKAREQSQAFVDMAAQPGEHVSPWATIMQPCKPATQRCLCARSHNHTSMPSPVPTPTPAPTITQPCKPSMRLRPPSHKHVCPCVPACSHHHASL